MSKSTKSIRVDAHPNRYSIVSRILARTHPRFDGKKFVKGMTVEQACAEENLTSMAIYKWMKEDPALKSMWTEGKEGQKASMIAKAMSNVEDALYGGVKLRPKELVDVSLRFLEKTSDDFKDKIELNGKVDSEITVPLEELIRKARELSDKLEQKEGANSE